MNKGLSTPDRHGSGSIFTLKSNKGDAAYMSPHSNKNPISTRLRDDMLAQKADAEPGIRK